MILIGRKTYDLVNLLTSSGTSSLQLALGVGSAAREVALDIGSSAVGVAYKAVNEVIVDIGNVCAYSQTSSRQLEGCLQRRRGSIRYQ